LDVPQELQVAAEIAISHRAITSLQALEREASEFPLSNPQLCFSHLIELEAIAAEADHLHCQLKLPEIKQILERIVYRSLWSLLTNLNSTTAEADIQWIDRLLALAQKLHLHLSLDRTQELFFQILHTQVLPQLAVCHQNGEVASTAGISLAIDPNENRHPSPAEPTVATGSYWSAAQLRQLLLLGQKLTIDVQYWLALLG
jgi:alpha-amylase/alpha-mannosidase (GH57 family)